MTWSRKAHAPSAIPLFPDRCHPHYFHAGFSCEDEQMVYFTGNTPVFIHHESDRDSFRMITAQFCVNEHAKQMDIVGAFDVRQISVKRAVKT